MREIKCKLRRHRKSNGCRLLLIGMAIVLLTQLQQVQAQDNALPSSLPVPNTHPLPQRLAQWQDSTGSGDYFSVVKPTPVGYLVWWQFPIKVYVQRPTDP